MSNSAKVSTSEVATFLTCKQRWMYAHHPSYNLEPRTLGMALTRGVIGHAALETYYQAIFDGSSHETAVKLAEEFIVSKSLNEIMVGDSEKAKMISSLGVLLKRYYESMQWLISKYNIVGVENVVTAPLPGAPDIQFAGRVDLTLGVKAGSYKGELIPWDHKFCYNFWPENAIKMNVQLPNYIWCLREMGHHSRSGYISMLRHRENAQDFFKQEEISTTSFMRAKFISNHVEAAKEIVDLKNKTKVGLNEGITRSVSKFNCEYCPFVTLCYTEASGEDASTMVKASYRKNSYGYDNVLDVE